MEKVDLTVSIESLKLDVLNYCLDAKGDTTVQKELEKRLEELYTENVSEEMRGYIDSKIKPASSKSKSKRPAPKVQERENKTPQGEADKDGKGAQREDALSQKSGVQPPQVE